MKMVMVQVIISLILCTLGVDDIKHCQKLNKYWLDRAMQAKILAAQARQCLQRVKECHNQIDDARKQRESSIRSLFLPTEEEASIDLDGTTSNTEGQDYFGEFAQESNPDIGILEAVGDETSCHDESDFLDHTLKIRVVCTHSDTESQKS